MTIEDLVGAYGTSYDALRLAVGDTLEQLWLELGGPDDRRALDFAGTAVDVVNGAAADTAELVDNYVAEYVGTVSGRPTGPSGLDLAQFAVDQLRGVPGLDVYRRPAIEARRLLAAGRPFEDAMAQAGRRASATGQADIGLAHREAGRQSMSSAAGVDGYRRVLTAASCTLCMIASTQRYRSGELMPIHTRCDCRVAPIVDGADYGRVINRDLYRELKSSGQLARFNAGNRGTTGASRAASAERRRAQQSIEGIGHGNQTALELGAPPAPSPAVRHHGELGPVLVDERHDFTKVTPSSSTKARADLEPSRLAEPDASPPAKVTTQHPHPPAAEPSAPPRAPSEPPAPHRPRYSVDSPEVQRAAARRNVAPDRVAAELNAKAERRAAAAAADRAEARALTVDSPNVVAAAARHGVTPDEVLTARNRLREVRRAISDEATRVQAQAFADLDQWDAVKIKRPPRSTAVSGSGSKLRRGEYDWLERIGSSERARLSRIWYTDSPTASPDLIAQRISHALGRDVDVDEAVDIWLDRNRTAEAAGALRRGKLPAGRAYSDRIDIDGLLPGIEADGYNISKVLGDDLDAAGHIASVERKTLQREAEDYLGAALDPQLGPAPYRMSFQSWEAEVRDLEYGLRNHPAELAADAAQRLEELVPYYLDEPGTTFEELYARIISTAHKADIEVPEHARIPWQS